MTERRPTAKTYARPPAIPVETKVPFAFVHINKCGGSSVEIALGIGKRHATAKVMRADLGAEDWAKRFTFAIVRNPFERVVSIYYYRVRTDQSGMGNRHLNINQWVEKVWGEGDASYRGEAILTAPAVEWISAEGAVIVDEIGKLETIGTDWARIAETLGVEPSLPVTNTNAHPPYRAVLDGGSRALLERAFAPDLEIFGYDW